jgi:monovalent cation:proton antiporter-2 (CPA2) family protein
VKKSKSKVSAFRGWTKKQRAKSLTTALVFFSTILSFTHTEQANYQTLGDSPSSAVVRQVASNDHLQTQLASRGGRSEISSSSPTQSMRDLLSKTKSAATNALSMNGGAKAKAPEVQITEATTRTFKSAFEELNSFMKGPKSDTLLLLLATALITPICKIIGTSPIIGFLAAGMALGPNALGLISGIHSTETLAELGIVFFLFEMGIELSVERLTSMKKDVFGLGLCQFVTTAAAIALAGSFCNLPANALVVLGGGLALSSSAFVLQLLKDNNQMATRFGKASFGVLLFQDLAVVPLLVVTPILAGGGQGLASALGSAVVKAGIALTSIFFAGRVILNPLFNIVAKSKSQEAFLGVVLLTVLSMSFLTEGLGLSNTLGAFLAGVLLSETKYRYQIEADIAPFRGILLGLFFVTVGFEIDLGLIASNLPLVSSIVAAIVLIKTTVLTALSKSFGLSLSNSLQTGLMLSQGGEFAFVAFGLARSLGILDPATTKLLLTSVALTMAITPTLAALGGSLAKKMEEGSDFTHYLGQDSEANEIRDSNDFAIVVGYGKVGRLVCELLDKKLFNYVGLELNPNKAIEARNKGLPVFYGDIGRPEVAEAFGADKANAIILTISDKAEINRAVISLRRAFPDKRIFARAVDADHAERLQRTLDVIAMVPVVPEDSILLSLPFGGAVLRSLGAEREEVNAILEQTRKEILSTKNLGDYQEKDIVLEQLVVKKLDESSKKEKKKDGSKDDTSKSTTDNIEEEKKPTMVEQVIKTMTEDIEVEKRKEQMDRDTSDEVTAEELIAEEEEENGGGQQTKDEAAGLKT